MTNNAEKRFNMLQRKTKNVPCDERECKRMKMMKNMHMMKNDGRLQKAQTMKHDEDDET